MGCYAHAYRRLNMNHFTNYLSFCLNYKAKNYLTIFKDLEVIDEKENKLKITKGSKIKLDSYEEDKSTCKVRLDMTLIDQKTKCFYDLEWNEEIPITHFVNAQEAYKHCYFTKIPLTENLENFIFSRSAKFASKYACDVSRKRLSSFLEEKVFKNYRYLTTYCIEFNINLTENQEKIFLNDDTGEFVANYALQKIRGRLPDTLHNYLIMKFADVDKYRSYWINRYFESIK